MKRLLSFGVAVAALVLSACGGGGGNTITSPPAAGGAASGVATVELTAASNTLNSAADGSTTVQITALVRDAGNVVIENVPIGWQASSGQFASTEGTTNDAGLAIAQLSNGTDPTNRTITVTVTAGAITQTVNVQVVGTTLTILGPPALALNDMGVYTLQLRDSLLNGIANRTITLSSANGNALPASVVTPADGGDAQFNLTATMPGGDTITAQALGLTANLPVAVSNDIFTIETPLAAEELDLGVAHNVTVLWIQGGVPQVGQTIIFTATRGTIPATGVTDGTGRATVQLTGTTSAGPVTITATNPGGTTTNVTAELIATVADSIDLQASPLTVTVGQNSTLTATVRDDNAIPNLVKNKTVVFVIDQDSTGGFLTIGAALTDSNGQAQSAYTAGTVPSASGGVIVRAFVLENPPLIPAVENMVGLTVVGAAIDLSIGTGDELFEPTPSLYSEEWAIIATDTSGTAPALVQNQIIQASIRSVFYHKGRMQLVDDGTGDLDWCPSVDGINCGYAATCMDEDMNRDGFLDPAEDTNTNGSLEAGNRATLAALAPTAPADACGSISALGGPTTLVQTDATGIARVCVIYPQGDNLWVDVEIKGLLNVFGTEFDETRRFTLSALALDLDDETSNPAGQFSPFGQANVCTNPL